MTYPIRRTGLLNTAIEVSGWPFANVLTVSTTDLDADFATIAEAITAASAGDVIEIDPGTYTEILTVNKAITLRGRDRNNTEITSSTAFSIVVSLTAVGAKLLNLKITHTGVGLSDICVLVTANDCVIENCILEKSSASNTGVGIENTSGTGLIVRETEIIVSGGTAFNRCYGGNTAASDVEFIRCILNCSGTSSSEISLNHASAVVTVTETVLVNGTVTINANLGTFNGTLQDAILTKNVSGAPAAFNDVGFIDEAGEYQTTNFEADNVAWCVVVVGNDDDDNIFIKRRGNVIVNFIGAAPSAEDFLITSTTGGSAKQQVTMRSEIFAVATANGSGGKVRALLLTGTESKTVTSSNEWFRHAAFADTSNFVATINGAPTPTSVVYNAPSAGAENTIAPIAGMLTRIVLHNTTRGTSRIMTAVNTGTNTITTVSSIDAWANGDTITAQSQTAVAAGPQFFYDLELTGQTVVPLLARSIKFNLLAFDTGGAVTSVGHPFEANSASKTVQASNEVAGGQVWNFVDIKLTDQKFCFSWGASGAATALPILRIQGYDLAVP